MATTGQQAAATGASPANGNAARATLIYDGTCRFCSRLARAAARLDRDGRLELIASGDRAVPNRFPSLTPEACGAALQLVTPGGETRQGAAAVAGALSLLPGLGWLGALLRLPGVRRLAALAYGVIARHRHCLA